MSRHLTGPEENELRKVFDNTLPYSRMHISDGSGIGNAQYTTRNITDYTLHLGPDMFKGILWSDHVQRHLRPRIDARVAGPSRVVPLGIHGQLAAAPGRGPR